MHRVAALPQAPARGTGRRASRPARRLRGGEQHTSRQGDSPRRSVGQGRGGPPRVSTVFIAAAKGRYVFVARVRARASASASASASACARVRACACVRVCVSMSMYVQWVRARAARRLARRETREASPCCPSAAAPPRPPRRQPDTGADREGSEGARGSLLQAPRRAVTSRRAPSRKAAQSHSCSPEPGRTPDRSADTPANSRTGPVTGGSLHGTAASPPPGAPTTRCRTPCTTRSSVSKKRSASAGTAATSAIGSYMLKPRTCKWRDQPRSAEISGDEHTARRSPSHGSLFESRRISANLTRSQIETSSARSRPSPPRNVSQNQRLSHRTGSPARDGESAGAHARRHSRSIDVRCVSCSRDTAEMGARQSRDTAEMRPEIARMRLRCSGDEAERWPRCGRVAGRARLLQPPPDLSSRRREVVVGGARHLRCGEERRGRDQRRGAAR